jgi:hypothetical protein
LIGAPKAPGSKSGLHGVIYRRLNLFDPTFVAQIGQYSHERVIVDIDIAKDDRMIYLAGLFYEFLYQGLLFLILSVLHTKD